MKRMLIYADSSVIGGCEDAEFATESTALWRTFVAGTNILLLSTHTLAELRRAPAAVRRRIEEVPRRHQVILSETTEAMGLAQAYVAAGAIGRGSHADALHVALATVGGADIIVSWNFKHVVNLKRIKLFQAVNLRCGYGMIEFRTPREVLDYDGEAQVL